MNAGVLLFGAGATVLLNIGLKACLKIPVMTLTARLTFTNVEFKDQVDIQRYNYQDFL